METLLQSLASPGDMSGQQWLLVVIMLLIVVGGAWFVLRLYRIIQADRKRQYVPNIGRKRLQQAAGTDQHDRAGDGGAAETGRGDENADDSRG